jgi:DNA-binding FadR family transcriptional regulator
MSEEELRKKVEFIVEQRAQVVGIIGKLAETQERAAAEFAEFRKQTESRFAALAAAHAETDERLNIFINVVEKYIRERRNGRGRNVETDESAPSV